MNGSPRLWTGPAKSPLLWGGLASVGFYAIIETWFSSNRYLHEYFLSHPVEYVTTTMFFLGLAVLAIKTIGLTFQSTYSRGGVGLLLGPIRQGGQPVSDCGKLLSRLESLPPRRQNDLLVKRLHAVLERIRRCQSAEGIEEELKFLAGQEEDRIYESYSLFRVVIWAIPILGFLGTVIGITLAIANLAPDAVEESLPQTIGALSVAFSTTTQALSLSIVLMFAKYLVSRGENELLADLEHRTDQELLGRFESISDSPTGQVEAMRRMTEMVLRATEHLVERQTELWRESLDALQGRWTEMTARSGQTLEKALTAATGEGLKRHAKQLGQIEHDAAERNQTHWNQVQRELTQSAKASTRLHESVQHQAEVLEKTVLATGQVARLEETLNRNLASLAGAKNFEQTVMSLAATIHLLNSRLQETPSHSEAVQLESGKKKPGQAA